MTEQQEHTSRLEPTGVERGLIASGLVFIALLLTSGFLLPQLPSWGTPVEEIAAPYREHYTAFLTSRMILGFGTLFFLLFTGGLYSFLRRAEGSPGTLAILAFGGGVAFTVMQYVVYALQLGTILVGKQQEIPPETIYTLTGVFQAAGTFAGFTLVFFLAATSACMLRTRILPRWIGWVGLVSAASTLAGDLSTSDESILVLFAFLGLILFVVWTVATSIVTLRQSRARGTAAQAGPAQA